VVFGDFINKIGGDQGKDKGGKAERNFRKTKDGGPEFENDVIEGRVEVGGRKLGNNVEEREIFNQIGSNGFVEPERLAKSEKVHKPV
jgi:hypothetical protein